MQAPSCRLAGFKVVFTGFTALFKATGNRIRPASSLIRFSDYINGLLDLVMRHHPFAHLPYWRLLHPT